MWAPATAIASVLALQSAAPSPPPVAAAAPAPQDAKPLGWSLDDASGVMTHDSTGVRFPKSHGDLVRGNVTTGDDQTGDADADGKDLLETSVGLLSLVQLEP